MPTQLSHRGAVAEFRGVRIGFSGGTEDPTNRAPALCFRPIAPAALAYFGLVEGPADSRYGLDVKPQLDDDVDALRARVAELEARLAALEARR